MYLHRYPWGGYPWDGYLWAGTRLYMHGGILEAFLFLCEWCPQEYSFLHAVHSHNSLFNRYMLLIFHSNKLDIIHRLLFSYFAAIIIIIMHNVVVVIEIARTCKLTQTTLNAEVATYLYAHFIFIFTLNLGVSISREILKFLFLS